VISSPYDLKSYLISVYLVFSFLIGGLAANSIMIGLPTPVLDLMQVCTLRILRHSLPDAPF